MTLPQKSLSKLNVLFIVGWWLVAVSGFALAGMLFHNFPLAYFPFHPTRLGPFHLFPAVVGFFFGALPALPVGGIQLLFLRRHLRISWGWLVSVSVGMGLMHFLSDGFENALDLSLAVLLGGWAVGLFQRRLLRPHLASSGWWVLVSAMSWYLGWMVGSILLRVGITPYLTWLPGELYVKQHAVLGAMVGVMYSSSTVLLLMGLLKNRSFNFGLRLRPHWQRMRH